MRFYFHVRHDGAYRDEVGSDFPDVEVAWREAVKSAGEMIRDLDGKMATAPEWRMDVASEGGELFSLRFIAERPAKT